MTELNGAIAVTRFGMGARQGEIADARSDPRGWLISQLSASNSALITDPALRTSKEAASEMATSNRGRKMMRKKSDDTDAVKAQIKVQRRARRKQLELEIHARTAHAIETKQSFVERWVRFWSNHFTVAASKLEMIALVGPFEREAIRPNVLGSFTDLLNAAVFHPSMLLYLDNHRSFGPSTAIAKRRKIGLNENLAREVLELHTLGVKGGYSQQDVTAFAKTLTGWTISAPPLRSSNFGDVIFEARLHEPGAHTILGKRYIGNGAAQAKAVLTNLAMSPATAHHISEKLVRHFVSDDPPLSAVEKLKAVFLKTRGDLTALAVAVIGLDEAWEPQQRKFKSPEELLISAARALGIGAVYGKDTRKIFESFGQTPFGAPSPDGWADDAAAWSGPDALKKRLEWANRAAQRVPVAINADMFSQIALGSIMSERTRLSIGRAESRVQGLTLALMAPEFQRR